MAQGTLDERRIWAGVYGLPGINLKAIFNYGRYLKQVE